MTRSEIRPLTGLRAVAALWVVAHHGRRAFHAILPVFPMQLAERGYLAVDVFFVLSGFILSYNYAGRIDSRPRYFSFIGHRIARIYPLHLAMLLAVGILARTALALGFHVGTPENFRIDYHLPLHLFLLHAWGFEGRLMWNLPSWSISAEFFAYLLFPFFDGIAARVRRPLALAGAALISVVLTVVVLKALGHRALHVPTEHALVRVSGEFLAGCLVYHLYATRSAVAPASNLLGDALVVAVGLLALFPVADPLMPIGACLLVYALGRGRGPVVGLFALSPVVWLGRISYSIYMTHLPVLSVLNRIYPAAILGGMDLAGRTVAVFVYAFAIIGVAATSYTFLEVPARRRISRWVDSKYASPGP